MKEGNDNSMESNDNTIIAEYGVEIIPAEGISKEEYKKIDINSDAFARINACLQDVPHIAKEIYDNKIIGETYRVVYDRGLGVLQKAAGKDNLFCANVVSTKANNDIKGQALLQKADTNTVSQLALSAFTIASVATSQYFLARIDKKLTSIDGKLNEIYKVIEIDKKSRLWAHGEYLRQVNDTLSYILQNDTLKQATLVSVQNIRMESLASIRSYYERLEDLKSSLNENDGYKKLNENLDGYKGYLPPYWYAVYLYEFAHYLEVVLSEAVDETYLNYISADMERIYSQFDECNNIYSDAIKKYIDDVKALKANTVPANIMDGLGKVLQLGYVPAMNPLVGLGAKGAGFAMEFGAKARKDFQIGQKNNEKQDVLEILNDALEQYKNSDPIEIPIENIKLINNTYNKPFELLVDGDDIYIKSDE